MALSVTHYGVTLVVLLFSLNVYSESTTDNVENKLAQHSFKLIEPRDLDEIQGMIIDNTMTRLGEGFYNPFSQLLNAELDPLKVNLTVKEAATARYGSIISIIHRNTVIFRTIITPGKRKAKEEAERAVDVVISHIARWEIERKFADTFDLAHDEF